MKIPKLKSHLPKIYDNTEPDLILVSPSVLDNKLREFEKINQARDSITGDIALAITLLVAVLATTFKDFSFISGPTIKGAFIAGLVVVIVKIGHSLYKIFWINKQSRVDVIDSLKQQNLCQLKNQTKAKK